MAFDSFAASLNALLPRLSLKDYIGRPVSAQRRALEAACRLLSRQGAERDWSYDLALHRWAHDACQELERREEASLEATGREARTAAKPEPRLEEAA